MNYHTLSDFRTESGPALDGLISQVLAVLMDKRLLKLYRVAQDGTRVRASAGSASFRRKRTLERCLKHARAHLAALAREAEQQNSAPTARVEAARQRAAREQAQRVEQALAELEHLGAAKARAKNHPQRKGEVRHRPPIPRRG